ncbi:MAG: Ig-like domain-containing protein [Verrucomicrobia bacterium]|nr:Ig-like domain-containing protein [Verrucomicrobiota bacterium]
MEYAIAPELTKAGLQFQFPINTFKNRGYTVEVSTNLHDWTTSYAFFSFADGYAFADTNAYTAQRRFYRIADRTEDMPPPPNDNFADRIPLTGLPNTTFGYNANATSEPGEPGYAWESVWWSWTAPVSGLVAIGTDGSMGWHYVQVYTGSSTNSLTVVTNLSAGYYSSRFEFYAVAGTTYQLQVGGDPGGIRLVITAPPALVVTRPQNNSAFLGPTNIAISASTTDNDGSITGLAFYTDWELLGSTANSSLSMVWSNVAVGAHSIQVEATDNSGMTTTSNLMVYVRPPNDNFANRIPITGSSASVTGTNSGASKEPGELNHAGYAGGASVWWSWTSPFNGYIAISAELISDWGYLQSDLLGVYTGTSVYNLTVIASNAAPTWGTSAQVSFVANAGVTYQIAVDGQSGYTGNIALRLIPTQAPTVNITWPANNAVLSAPTNLTITATAHDNDGSITRVDFYNYGMSDLIGSATNPPYTTILNSPYGGTHRLFAKATDNMGAYAWSAPVSISVLPPTNFYVALTSPSEGAVFTAPANILITASAFDPNGVVTQVRFGTMFSTIIGTATRFPYSMIWSNLGPGYYTIGAEAEDNLRHSVFSDPVDFVVNYPETTLTLGVPAAGLSGGIGSDSYFKVTVPPGATSLQISTSGGVGDCDLYVAYGYQPDLFDYDYRPYLSGNNETVTISSPPEGDWHIMLDGYNSYSGVTLQVRTY